MCKYYPVIDKRVTRSEDFLNFLGVSISLPNNNKQRIQVIFTLDNFHKIKIVTPA